jgi:predicted DNA binding CopG/RHH family protein
MLHGMEPAAHNSSSPGTSSFSGLLASLASRSKKESDLAGAWSDNGLGDDIVTLSYESALRNHARYRPPDDGDLRLPAVDGNVGGAEKTAPVAVKNAPDLAARSGMLQHTAQDRDLRTSSVTIRLSDAECSRVRQRAAEAGLTVSAYLRSCVLEADALRAQVKEALAEMKTAAGTECAAEPARRPWLGWIRRKAKPK